MCSTHISNSQHCSILERILKIASTTWEWCYENWEFVVMMELCIVISLCSRYCT